MHAYGITLQSGRTRGVLIGDLRPTFQVLGFSLLRNLQRVITIEVPFLLYLRDFFAMYEIMRVAIKP